MPRPAVHSSGGVVTVAYDRRTWQLEPGAELTVGRSSTCAVRLPQDPHLSRLAASLRRLPECVLVANLSQTKPLVLRPPTGGDQIVQPTAATTSLPYAKFEIVLAGADRPIVLAVDASAITPARSAAGRTASVATAEAPIDLTPSQHRVLVELCRPLLGRSGQAARPATYQEIADALGLQPNYVRNVIKAVREQLDGYGVPGLDGTGQPNEDFRLPLARWAIWSGRVTPGDLGGGR